jgi:uncharacterized cupin superfamily protein
MEIVIKRLKESDYLKMGIHEWPIWEKEISVFDWSCQEKEQFYLIEGEVTIKTHEAEYKVLPGDYVICPKGLSCNWEITKYAKKHYHFVEK